MIALKVPMVIHFEAAITNQPILHHYNILFTCYYFWPYIEEVRALLLLTNDKERACQNIPRADIQRRIQCNVNSQLVRPTGGTDNQALEIVEVATTDPEVKSIQDGDHQSNGKAPVMAAEKLPDQKSEPSDDNLSLVVHGKRGIWGSLEHRWLI